MRHSLNWRGSVYTENDIYRAVPVARTIVAPGTSLKKGGCELNVTVQFVQTPSPILMPVVCSLDVFYVPHRLVWSGWVDFISNPDTSTTGVPTTPTNSVDFFDPTSGRTVLYRRGYKAAYNAYFGSRSLAEDGMSDVFYDNVEDDTVVALGRVAAPEQLGRLFTAVSEMPEINYIQSVANTIPLREFTAAQNAMIGRNLRERTGSAYVDAMQRLGVSLDWRIQQAPEHLGGTVKVFKSRVIDGTSGSDLGKPVSAFDGSISVVYGGQFLAEHGYIVGIFSARPVMPVKDGYGCLDGSIPGPTGFPRGTAEDQNVRVVTGAMVSAGGNSQNIPNMAWYHHGENIKGFYSSPGAFVPQMDVNNPGYRAYPNPSTWPALSILSGKHYALAATHNVRGLTTVPRSVGLVPKADDVYRT